ncbi:MAG: hypothetical protein WBM83_14070 [Flavobacteriaceae bacterium]
MPTQLNLDIDIVKVVVKWTLNSASNSDFSFYPQTEKAFRLQQKLLKDKGIEWYVLRIHYIDHDID